MFLIVVIKMLGKNSLISLEFVVKLCESEYFILASDDAILPLGLEEIDCLVNEYPKVEIVSSRAQCINESGEVFKEDALIKNMFLKLSILRQLGFL